MKKVTFHCANGTETGETYHLYEEGGFDLTETDDLFTAELGQFYGRGGEFKLIATKFP
jgi:hypothetical protein